MPTATLAAAERFPVTARINGRRFEISVARPLPLRATRKVPESCPILFVLDADLTFGTAVERMSMYAGMGKLESAVIVGIGFPGDVFDSLKARSYDFTPETPPEAHRDLAGILGGEYGGADKFLTFLIDELAPLIRARVPEASRSRVMLHGYSLGGLFAAYALLSRPETFEMVSMISPALWWNDFALLRKREQFIQRLRTTGARPHVLVGVGALEQEEPKTAPSGVDLEEIRANVRAARMVDAAKEFADDLSTLSIGEVQFVAFAHEDHPGALTAGTGRAIGFALGRGR